MMRIRLGVPDELDDKDRKAALEAALESVTRSTLPLIRSGKIPTAADAIRAKKVEWRPEPPGDEHFDLAPTVLARGWGDCDDLANWHTASLRATGQDRGARNHVYKTGPERWHAVTKRSDGSIDDPSIAAGMGRNGHGVSGYGVNGSPLIVGAYAPIQPPMSSDGRLCIAIAPSKDPTKPAIWFARCDVPDRLDPWDWCSMSAGDHPARALLHAVKGCQQVAGAGLYPADDARLMAIEGLVLGQTPEQVAESLHAVMGDYVDADAVVGEAAQSVGFFRNLWRAVASPITSTAQFIRKPSLKNFGRVFTQPVSTAFKAVSPIAKMAKPFGSVIRFIPGIGPVAASAVDLLANPPKNLREAGQFAARQAAGFVPGVGPVLTAIPGLPGISGPLSRAMAAGAHKQDPKLAGAPHLMYEQGMVARPWGAEGPAVLRF